MQGCSIMALFKLRTNVAITLLTNFLALSILTGLAPAFHRHLWVTAENMIFMPGCRSLSWCRSSFMVFTSWTLLTTPRSLPPQWMRRTSGAALPHREWEKNRRSHFHRSPPQPNQQTRTPGRLRLLPMVSAALWAPRLT